MILAEAVKLLNFHKTFLAANDPDYRYEYLEDLADDNSSGSGVKLAEAIEIALEIILKGAAVQDGKSQDYPRAS
jgi:hypothetical protein